MTVCKHKNILVAHYANEETKMSIGCRVRCIDCDKMLFKTKDKGKEIAYKYIEDNKDKFSTLDDFTCDELNNRFGIKKYNDINIITREELGDNLCKYCELTEYGNKEINTNQFNLCEGICCDDAYSNYLNEIN